MPDSLAGAGPKHFSREEEAAPPVCCYAREDGFARKEGAIFPVCSPKSNPDLTSLGEFSSPP